MKRYIIPMLLLCLLAASCGSREREYGPVEKVIVDAIVERYPDCLDVEFSSLVKVDSTTYGQEIQRRRDLFEYKLKADGKLRERFRAARMRTNMRRKDGDMANDTRILAGIDSLEAALAPVLGDIAYYDYRWSAVAHLKDSDVTCTDMYANVSPDLTFCRLVVKAGEVHKGMGRIIPGYMELLRGGSEDTEE